MAAMELTLDLPRAMRILGLTTLPRNRQELARRIAANHPASNPWNRVQTLAYRTVWESLQPACQDEPPLAA